jgi:hypothetical protein
MEPSAPIDDVTCPYCGCLVLVRRSAVARANNSLVRSVAVALAFVMLIVCLSLGRGAVATLGMGFGEALVLGIISVLLFGKLWYC